MTEMTEPLSWVHDIAQSAGSGAARTRTGTPAERAALAAALDILSCDRLDVRYTLKPFGRDRYRLTGTLEADVVQACVVTLEPLAWSSIGAIPKPRPAKPPAAPSPRWPSSRNRNEAVGPAVEWRSISMLSHQGKRVCSAPAYGSAGSAGQKADIFQCHLAGDDQGR
jgi:hypothetical protein